MNHLRNVRWRLICAEIALGSVVFLYNFGGFLQYAATRWAPPWLGGAVASVLQLSNDALTVVTGSGAAWSSRLATWLVIGLWSYIVVVIVTSLLYLRPDRLTNGLSGLCAGLGAIVLLSWTALLLVKIATLMAWIGRLISTIGNAVFHFIEGIVTAVLPYLAAAAFIVLVAWALFSWVRKLGLNNVLSALLLLLCAGVAWLLSPVLRWCYLAILLPVVHFAGMVLGWVLGVLSAILVGVAIALAAAGVIVGLIIALEIMGKLLIEQFRTAWHAPRGDKAMALAGFSVGSSFAVLLTVTAGLPDVAASIDTAWQQHAWLFNTWSPAASHLQALPDEFASAFAFLFKHASAPVFDALILIVLLPFSAVAAMRWANVEDRIWTAQELGGDAREITRALAAGLGLQLLSVILPRE